MFTDILNDEIPNSQPLSLPSSNDSQPTEEDVSKTIERNRPFKRCGQQGEFRCVDEIDPKYRDVFTYRYFNLVQSRVIEDALYSDKSMVVCAPTGSGKTVVFEMAIVQLLIEIEDNNYMGDYKIIYMAPVKSLCSERLSEWYPKFTRLGLLCIEVTGDTDVDFPQLKPYRIIITTPEKWDMLTRRWKDHKGLVEVIKLFLIDEVHILNDEVRGPVLEAVVSRMKTVECSAQSSHRIEQLQRQYGGGSSHEEVVPPRIRFVAASATVGNPEDVAAWLGTAGRPAVFYKFGEECRPVRLRRVVEGYPCAAGASIFKFDIILNYKIWPIIQRYHNGKPTLIFCNTRKSVLLTAETLSREITVGFSPEQKTKLMEIASHIKTKKIQSLVLSGVGCHHAGLLYEERQTIEQAFRNRELPILITTTTLAMGVNLPAHLVIIKNTQQYVNGTYQEYSISTILQMVGRAGRPQFDTEATAVIMTRLTDKARYEALVGGCEPLQSYLHKRLAENLNSEAALCTVCDVAQCVQWLNSTFFSVRAARDPKRYLGLPLTAPANQISKKIEELCVKAMNGLASARLITMDEACCIESTEAGRLMSVYYLDLETMKLIMKIEGSESLEQLLWLVCESHELADMHLRVDERRCLNALNRNNAAATIRFPMKGKISTRQMKSNCVIQAILGCLPIPDPSLNQEATKIIRIAERVCKCLVAYVTRSNIVSQKAKYFSAVLNSLILAKCVSAHLWENSPYMSKQLRGIGPTLSAALASAGKVNFTLIEESHPRDLERIMNKAPPAGNILRKQVSLIPKYTFKLTPLDDKTVQIQLLLINAAQLAENMEHLTAGANHKSYIIVGDTENYILYFSSFRDSDLISVYDGCITFEITRLHNHEHKIMVHCISSNFVGVDEHSKHIFQSVLLSENEKINTVANVEKVEQQEGPKNQKRRNTDGISSCKEKKKRENNLIETLKNLKKSFCESTKDIKTELNKTKNLSDSVLQDLLEPGQDRSDNNCKFEPVTFNTTSNPDDDKELMSSPNINDEEITSILRDIESEINCNAIDNASIAKAKTILYKQANNKEKEINKIQWPVNKNTLPKYNQKYINCKNNYSFIDTLEKEGSVEKELKDTKTEVGLSNTVKQQIEQFLEKTQGNSERTQTINHFMIDNNKNKELSRVESEPYTNITENKVTNDVPVHNTSEDQATELSTFKNTQQSESNNLEINNKSYVDPFNLDTKYNNDNTVKKTDIADNSTLELDRSLLLSKSNQKSIPSNINDAEMLNKTNFLNPSSIIAHHIPESNNNPTVLLQAPTITEKFDCIAKSDDFEIISNNIDPLNLNSTYLYDDTAKETFNTGNFTEDQNTSLSEFDHKSILSNINDANKTNIANLTSGDNVNTSHQNNTDDYEYINNYSFSASSINIITKNDANRRIQILNKLKIDLNVTEIVYKEASSKEYKTNEEYSKNFCTEGPKKSQDIVESNNNNLEAVSNISNNEIKACITNHKMQNDNIKSQCISNSATNDIQDLKHNTTNNQNAIKDIIEKYKMKTKERSETQQKYIKPPSNNTFTSTVKSKRQYRIRDLHNTENSLPKYMIPENFSQIPNDDKDEKELATIPSLVDDCNVKHISPPHETNFDDNTALKCSPMKIDSGSASIHTESEDIKSFITESETEEINLSMFNPKTLLQCLGEDHSIVIPPPLEFCDDDPYSPIQSHDQSRSEINTYTPLSSPSMEIEHLESSPSKIETWTLSQESDDDNSYNKYSPYNTFTIQKREKHSCRDSKLSQFKFEGRPKFKK